MPSEQGFIPGHTFVHMTGGTTCYHEAFKAPRDIFHWMCKGHVTGRHIFIYQPGYGFIYGCEVKVYGYRKGGLYGKLDIHVIKISFES